MTVSGLPLPIGDYLLCTFQIKTELNPFLLGCDLVDIHVWQIGSMACHSLCLHNVHCRNVGSARTFGLCNFIVPCLLHISGYFVLCEVG